MKSIPHITLTDVQGVYSGPEADLWELIMGEQVHLGGFASSLALADEAHISPGSLGIDLCCCTGAGMRFLVRFRDVRRMIGVDATPCMIERGRRRCAEQQTADRIEFREADACATGLPSHVADFVWGEDAWCYVVDKPRLTAEAVRLLKPSGRVAFTDWMEGPTPLTDADAARFLAFMKFPSMATLDDYRSWLSGAGCTVLAAHDTGRFGPCLDLYLDMIGKQLTYDALRILGFDQPLLQKVGAEMAFARQLVREGKLIQGLVVARRP